MSNGALVPYNDLERMGTMLAKSGLFGMKKPEEAIALCLIAQAEGKHPATAAQEYNIILGRPALKADAMLARFQAAGGKVNWLVYTDTKVEGEFSHPQGGSVKIDWSIEMATKLGYHTKDNWKKFPRAMMRARCISEGVRTVYPGIAVGIYTPEEVQDFDDKPIRDITPAEIDTSKPPSPFKTAALRKTFQENVAKSFHAAKSLKELQELMLLDKPKFELMEASGDERDEMSLGELRKQFKIAADRLKAETHDAETGEINEPAFLEKELAEQREAGMVDREGVPL